MFWFLVIAAIAAVVVVFLLARKNEVQCQPKTTTTEPTPKLGENLGSPLFKEDDGKKEIISYLTVGESVWALTPYGPQLFTITKVDHPEAHLNNAEFESLAFYDANYLSDSLAEKMSRGKGAWRISTILPIQIPAVPANDPRYEAANRHWLEDEYDFEDDFFDAMIFYYFLFEGFDQPYTYYDMYETPVYEDPVIVEEPPAEDTVEFEAVPAEPTEETFEKGIGDPSPEPEEIPDPPPVPEQESYKALHSTESRPEPEPEEIPDPPPVPEQESYTPPDPEPYDSGSSYDSGGDSGGFD